MNMSAYGVTELTLEKHVALGEGMIKDAGESTSPTRMILGPSHQCARSKPDVALLSESSSSLTDPAPSVGPIRSSP